MLLNNLMFICRSTVASLLLNKHLHINGLARENHLQVTDKSTEDVSSGHDSKSKEFLIMSTKPISLGESLKRTFSLRIKFENLPKKGRSEKPRKSLISQDFQDNNNSSGRKLSCSEPDLNKFREFILTQNGNFFSDAVCQYSNISNIHTISADSIHIQDSKDNEKESEKVPEVKKNIQSPPHLHDHIRFGEDKTSEKRQIKSSKDTYSPGKRLIKSSKAKLLGVLKESKRTEPLLVSVKPRTSSLDNLQNVETVKRPSLNKMKRERKVS